MHEPDYILDIPDGVLAEAAANRRKLVMIRQPDDYRGELDIHIRAPASDRIYTPVNPHVKVVDGFEEVMEASAEIGMRGANNHLLTLDLLYARAGMSSVTQARTYMLVGWDDLKPMALPPSGLRPAQYVSLTHGQFNNLFTAPGTTAHVCAGTFNYVAGPLRIVETESTAPARPTGWEAKTNIITDGRWHGTLRKLPAAYALAAGFKDQAEAIENIRNSHFARGRTVDYDSPVTALLFNRVDAKNITFRSANDSILTINAAPKSGRATRKLSL